MDDNLSWLIRNCVTYNFNTRRPIFCPLGTNLARIAVSHSRLGFEFSDSETTIHSINS